jgi:hypothetical protein
MNPLLNYLLLALLGTGTWVLANAACVPSVRQQQGSDSIVNITNILCKPLKNKDKTFMKQFVTKRL